MVTRLALAAVVAVIAGCRPAVPTYRPTSAALRAAPLYFYPARGPARAWLFFFGNDLGFWDAHQRLATRLAETGVSVVGVDVRPVLRALPDDSPAHRATVYADTIGALIRASRHELGADTLPVIIGGHSIGAELAIYTAAHVEVSRLAGVLALSPGLRGHLRVTLGDVTNTTEPSEPGSFAIADEICEVPAGVRIALVRGGHDSYRSVDSLFEAEGGTRLQRWVVPFAGHSMKSLTLAGPMISRAVDHTLARP